MADEVDYGKYLEKDPTPLMVHIEQWLKEKTGWDPKEARTKEEAFQAGVYLTVHLRGVHQASPENQDRLEQARSAAGSREEQAEQRRAERKAAGAKPRGRLPKTAAEDKAEEAAAPKRRGRPRKVAAETPAEEAPQAEAPKRRGRPRKAAAPAPEAAEPSNVTPIDKAAASKPVRRRRPAVRRDGEAAF